MSRKTDKAYEAILRAFESPNEKFDQLGDVDTGDIDKNFEKANPDPEGKSWSDWDKEKESDTASEEWDDEISPSNLMRIMEEEKELEEGKNGTSESFSEEDLENINEIFSDNKDYEAVLDFNADRDGESGGDRADDVSGTTDDSDNQITNLETESYDENQQGKRQVSKNVHNNQSHLFQLSPNHLMK